jgi:hypothetical protein
MPKKARRIAALAEREAIRKERAALRRDEFAHMAEPCDLDCPECDSHYARSRDLDERESAAQVRVPLSTFVNSKG